MNISKPKYNPELPEDFFIDVNPKIIKLLSTCIHNVVYEQPDRYYIAEYDGEYNIKDRYYVNDFNSKETYYLIYESLRNAKTELVCELLNIYQDVNIYGYDNLLLNIACSKGQHNVISKLINIGVDITTNNNLAIRLVSLLCNSYYYYYGDIIAIFELLLNNGADIHADNDFVLCCTSNNIYIFKYLLQLDYKYNITSRDNYCLQRCVHNYFNNMVNQFDKLEGEDFSHIVGAKEKILIDINGNEFVVSDIIKILLNLGANVNCRDGYIIDDVVKYGDKYIIELFIEYGANMDLVKTDSLLSIIKLMNCDMVKLLMEYGVNFNKLNYEPVKNLQKVEMANLLSKIGLNHEKILELI